MTLEQTQAIVDRLNRIHEMLTNMLTTLNLALDLYEELPIEERLWLREYCQHEQLRVIDHLSISFNSFTSTKSLRCM